MTFDPWTLGFQFLNFAILLFVLFRLLFKPIRDIMEKRRKQTAEALDAAEAARAEAEALKAGLAEEQGRIAQVRADMMETVRGEVEAERRRLLEGAAREADAALERGRALLETERGKYLSRMREQTVEAATRFAARILGDVADPALHRSILARFPEALGTIGPESEVPAEGEESIDVQVESAFELTEEERARVQSRIQETWPRARCAFAADDSLLAGVRMRARDHVYDFSLRGQLEALAAELKAAP